jgi:hypothetical protein
MLGIGFALVVFCGSQAALEGRSMKADADTRTWWCLAVAATIGGALATLPSANAVPPVAPCLGLSCPANVITDTDPGVCYAVENYTVMGMGNCTIVQTAGLPSGSQFPIGTTTNAFQAQNNASATCSFSVMVNDAQPVEITCPPKQIRQTGPGVVEYPPPVVTDNCFPLTICTPPSGSVFPIGETIVNCTAIENEIDSCTFPVVLVGPPGAPAAGSLGLLALAVVLGALGVWAVRRRFG